MRKIQKTISLEPMTSRLPSIVPAFMNNKIYYFDDDSLRERGYAYTSNYGMIPMNVIIPSKWRNKSKLCDYTPINGGCSVISFERLSKWYYKFKEYYHLLNDYGHCNTIYKSAVDYYYHESRMINPDSIDDIGISGFNISLSSNGVEITSFNSYQFIKGKGIDSISGVSIEDDVLTISGETNDSVSDELTTVSINLSEVLPYKQNKDDLIYGNDIQTYIDLDEEFKCMGGSAVTTSSSTIVDCNNKEVTKVMEAHDVGFYDWICENVIPTYTITSEYQEYWKKETLYYPDVIKWIGWFRERDQYSAATEDTCKTSEDCCECAEYVKRGGKAEYGKMQNWYNKIQNNIKREASSYCEYPNIIIPIELQNTIDDLGELSIFCQEYEDGVDYRTIPTTTSETKTVIHYESGNTHSGTTVLKDGVVYQLISGMGYSFDSKYMEYGFDENGWKQLKTNSGSTLLSGSTSSKLLSLYRQDYLTDDIGNVIEGLYNVGEQYYHQPKVGEVLEPLYQVGNIGNLVSVEDRENTFLGDEILSMVFYYADYDNELVSDRISAASNQVISAISSAETSIEDSDTTIYQEDVLCDITYSIGNTYLLESGNTSSEKLNKISSGVIYQETVQFVKTKVEYYLKNEERKVTPDKLKDPSGHSISYPIYVYKLVQQTQTIDDNAYNVEYEDSLAYFNYSANTYSSDEEDMISPLMREEYKLGISAPQSVDSDIYIDRGINSAFEKHIKLGEVKSMEALLQYGLNFFKIMDN